MFYLFILVKIRIAYHQYNITSLNPNKNIILNSYFLNYLLVTILLGRYTFLGFNDFKSSNAEVFIKNKCMFL